MSFGAVSISDPVIDSDLGKKATQTVSILCNNQLPFTLKGQPYLSGSGYPFSQYLIGSKPGNTDKLAYGIWIYGSYTSIFGDGSTSDGGKSNTYSNVGTGSVVNYGFYFGLRHMMQAYPKRAVIPDIYSSNYTMTLEF